jgi:SAM-dependent methyltransferase
MGEPIARYLLTQGYRVTGVDSSSEMLRLARNNCPEAEFIEANIESLDFQPEYDGIIAWDSIFHIPKSRHARVFQSLNRWLKPDAPLLLSLGGSEDEFTDTMFGIEFFYSGYAPAVSTALLQQAGLEIVLSEVDDPGSRGHLAVLCRKRD